MTFIRALAFGEAATPAWGALWLAGDDAPSSLGCVVGSASGILAGEFEAASAGGPWRLEGDAVSLLIAPSGPEAHGSGEADLRSLDQLCEVNGRVSLEGVEREFSCLGWRGTVEGDIDLRRMESFRHLAGWFEDGHGLSLVALRPAKARGQDSDLVAGGVLSPEGSRPVVDPRLSTSYDASGSPARAGLELWLEPEEPEDSNGSQPIDSEETKSDSEAERAFARRAAAEALGPALDWEVSQFSLHARLLRWHARGVDGTGVYLLGREP